MSRTTAKTPSEKRRGFRVTVTHSDGTNYGLTIAETNGHPDHTNVVATVRPADLLRLNDTVQAVLRASKKPATTIGPSRQKPIEHRRGPRSPSRPDRTRRRTRPPSRPHSRDRGGHRLDERRRGLLLVRQGHPPRRRRPQPSSPSPTALGRRTMTDTTAPRLLIEDWLPVTELGIESRRERAFVAAIPDLFSLHVWWARRPLVASAGVILASLLPPWSEELATAFPGEVRVDSEAHYKEWFLHLCGIWGDPDRGASQVRRRRGQWHPRSEPLRLQAGVQEQPESR